MIYLMSQKFLIKNIEKMVKYNDYFILDGENYYATGKSSNDVAIATKYNNSHSVGGFCPEVRLLNMLKKKKNGEDYNKEKLDKEIKKFISDKSFVASINVAFKSLVVGGANNPRNIFIVLPNVVYKYLARKYVKKMIKLAKVDFNFIFTQDDLKEDMKLLKNTLSNKQLKQIDEASKKIEKKYEISFKSDDDDD